MILKTSDPREPAATQELLTQLGEEDAKILMTWLWETHRGRGNYADILAAVVEHTHAEGTCFARNLLTMAKKPKHISEAEMEIMAFITPRIQAAVVAVQGHRGDQQVAVREFEKLCYELEEKLFNMFPQKHRATMKGAIISAFTHRGGYTLDVAKLVQALHMEDPLAATAASSR